MKKTILIAVSTLVIGIGVGIGAEYLLTHKPLPIESGVLIYLEKEVDGRPTYKVVFDDGEVMDYMYAEEIGESLLSGEWHYNEDAHIPLVSLNPTEN